MRSLVVVAAALCAFDAPRIARAQAGATSAARTVSMSASKTSSLSLAIVSGATQTLATLTDNAINTFATPVRVTASWNVAAGTSTVRLLASFANGAQALANGTNYIASSRVEGRIQTTPVTTWQPTAWRAFTENSSRGIGVNGSTLRMMNIPVTAANRSASRTMDLELRLNMTGQPAATAGTYTGTITFRAFTT